MPRNDSDSRPCRQRVNRRRLLQLAGVGVGSLTMTTTGRGTAHVAGSCADGPFQGSYSAETVNVSKIADRRVDYEKSEEQPDVDSVIEQSDPYDGSDSLPPAAGAQHPPTSDDLLTVGTKYDGIRDEFFIRPPLESKPIVAPSDAQIAVGHSKTVQAINQKIAIFSQRSGELELEVPFERLFDPLITEDGFILGYPVVADPRLRYDTNADRFVLIVFYTHFLSFLFDDSSPRAGNWLVAVSDTSNPNGEWHLYRIPTFSGNWPDYPSMGLDRDAIYLTGNAVPKTFELQDFDVELAILDKEAMYDGTEVPVNHFTGLLTTDTTDGFNFTVQAAFQPFSGGQSESYYLLNSQFGADKLTLWEVSDPLSQQNATVDCQQIVVNPFNMSWGLAAQQPGTDLVIETLAGRLMNLDYNDGSLWSAHTVRHNWDNETEECVAAIRWYEINPETATVIQSGTYGEPGTDYFLPHIHSDGNRTLMGYNVSGPETFPSLEVAGRTADFSQGEMEAAVSIQEGESSMIHPTKFGRRGDDADGDGDLEPVWWGDYMGISVHPSTDRFWVTGQYSPNIDVPRDGDEPDRYQTHIAEVSFDGGEGGTQRGKRDS